MEIYLDYESHFDAKELRPLYSFGFGHFTSFLVDSKGIFFWDEHVQRLKRNYLSLYQENSTIDFERAKSFILEKNFTGKGRITIFKKDNEKDAILFEFFKELPQEENIKIKTMARTFKNHESLKLPSYAESFSLLKQTRKEGFHDVLFTSEGGDILECSTSNIVAIKKDNKICMPSGSGIFHGIVENKFKSFLNKNNLTYSCEPIKSNEVQNLFLLNSVKLIKRACSLDNRILLEDDFSLNLKNDFLNYLYEQR